MASHLTARLSWHDDGRICERPDCNTYCVGIHSFSGDVVAREQDLESELEHAGKPVAMFQGANLPPCIYSINAFGLESIRGYSNPPDFFRGGAKRTEWDIPDGSVCVWPYEAMYGDGTLDEAGRRDNDRRSTNADKFFAEIEDNKSLIFYYANYSNPIGWTHLTSDST